MGPYLCLVRLVNCQNEILALKINVASQLSHFLLLFRAHCHTRDDGGERASAEVRHGSDAIRVADMRQ